MYTTYLASMFRSIRFGINEAHGRGVAMQLNYFLDNGGVTVGAGRHVRRQPGAHQAERDRPDARHHDACRRWATTRRPRQMIEKLGVVRPPVQAVLDRLKDVPVDIEPRFVTAEQLTKQ